MMGFFSSRKSTEHSPVRSRHEKERSRDVITTSPVAVIKSKWYNKSKSKPVPELPKEDPDAEVTVRVDHLRRTAAAPAESESSRSTVADGVTKTMAERLNELMKSHAEGMIEKQQRPFKFDSEHYQATLIGPPRFQLPPCPSHPFHVHIHVQTPHSWFTLHPIDYFPSIYGRHSSHGSSQARDEATAFLQGP
ncbi:hypothetical protein BN14_03181 [Rhizoctonia solani AG-1 IB]|uniref:Uncharacterized protein n=1 Tax=Thanatephorus cucumeris (strain AG1-IB / isolate 7/3/14) TaxID=1108050 RepID=M5BZS6_THACB|nr:hypothetical protein BN14_03181 [Rhizoctonia solani AG-1 IB]